MKDKKTIIIIILVLGIIGAFIGGYFLGQKNTLKCADTDTETLDNKEDTPSYDTETYTYNNFKPKEVSITAGDNDELTKGIEIKEMFFNEKKTTGKFNEAYAYGKNNNSVPVHITVVVEYYDANGKRVEKDTGTVYAYAGSEFINKVSIKDDSIYKTAKVTYTAVKTKAYETTIPANQIEITSQITTDKTITSFIKSNSDKEGYLDVTCLYYKNGKVIFGLIRGYLKVTPGTTEENKFYTNQQLRLGPDYNSELMEFDDYKVFIQGARNVDDENY